MRFLKQHYEKIILSAVLLALAASAVWMSLAIGEARNVPEPSPPRASKKPWQGVDLTAQRDSLQSAKQPPTIKLTGEHNLFNPVTWKLRSDGTKFKMTVGGPEALSVTDIRPFFYTIKLESQASEGFYMQAYHAKGNKPAHQFVKAGDKPTATKPYTITSVGTNAANGEVTLQLLLPDTQETVPVTADKPYQRVEGYTVDLKYNASDEKKTILSKTVDDSFTLSGEPYKIIALTNNSVTVQDTRTQQKNTIEWNGKP
jgi:hypothetical protein